MKIYQTTVGLGLIVLGSVLFESCASNDQKLENLDKGSAREVTLSTVKSGDTVFHITQQTIWFKGNKMTSKVDTIVTLDDGKLWVSDNNKDTTKLSNIPIYVTVQ